MTRTESLTRPEWLPTNVWPYELQAMRTRLGMVHVTEVGDRSSPTMLLLNGGMWSLLWRDVIADLAAEHHVVTMDLPGFGLSTPAVQETLTIPTLSGTVAEVTDGLDIGEVTLVPHDVGGPILLHWANRHREQGSRGSGREHIRLEA